MQYTMLHVFVMTHNLLQNNNSDSKRICLRNDMEIMQGISSLDHLPMDITLRLSDGNIKANKMMLSIVSPVFMKMLYGSFKEASSGEVDLPKDDYKIMKLLFDIVFEGSSELESLDDIIPLMEVVDRYEIKKFPMQHMCDEAILAELDPSNFVTLLQQFVGVMSEASVKEATNKVMCFCNNDFVSKFDKIKDLPEEVLLFLLQRNDIDNAEIELFDFLIKWHDHQTKELKTLHLTPQLFQCIRYYLISPRLLLTKVAGCSYIDKHVLMETLDYLLQFGEDNPQKTPRLFCSMKWKVKGGASIRYDMQNRKLCYVELKGDTIFSKLNNGSYSFTVSNNENLSLSVYKPGVHLCKIPADGITVTLFVYENDIFMKAAKGSKICSTFSATAHSFGINLTGSNNKFHIIHSSDVIAE